MKRQHTSEPNVKVPKTTAIWIKEEVDESFNDIPCQSDDVPIIDYDDMPNVIEMNPFKIEDETENPPVFDFDEERVVLFPDVWTESQWHDRQRKHEWLESRNNKLGCRACSSVKNSEPSKLKGVTLSSEWTKCEVGYNGYDREQKLRSLRTKISAHLSSAAHSRAVLILAEAERKELEAVILKQHESELQKTVYIFNSAYYIAKHDLPYSDHEGLIALQIKNNLDLGITSHSRVTCSEIINHISNEFKKRLSGKMILEQRKMSLIIDESTTLGTETALIVYIKTVIDNKEEIMFLDLVPLPDQSADSIVTALLHSLSSCGFSADYLKNNLVCFATDGASVMLGRNSDVAKILMNKLARPDLLVWYCLSHRLELTVQDTMNDIDATNHFEGFIDTVYTLHSKSTNNLNQLKEIAKDLADELFKIGCVLGVHWIASNFATIQAVWNSYSALVQHFKVAANDISRNNKNEREKFKILYLQMESIEFLSDVALLYDVLEEISSLAIQLQDRLCTVPKADKLLRRTLRVIRSLKEMPGEKETLIKKAMADMQFNGITLSNTSRGIPIDRVLFLTSLANSLETRCFTTTTPNQKQAGNETERNECINLLSDMDILNADTWDEDKSMLNVKFGESSIINLCALFRLEKTASILNGFREYYEGGGRRVPASMQSLNLCMKSLPCSTAECRSGLSAMNSIATPLRTELTLEDAASLMFIKLNGPPLSMFQGSMYVQSWKIHHQQTEGTRSQHQQGNVSQDTDTKELWELF